MKHKIRNENSGFTLVELIITIAVLAVISVPLLKYFSDSMRHNVRMKEQQNAVVAAQNVLEDLKVADVSLDTPDYLTSSATAAPGATPLPTMTVDWSTYATPVPGSAAYEVKGNYSLNNTSYTVKAKITPRNSLTNDAGGTKTYHKAEVPNMDSSKDMIATETTNYVENAKFHFHGKYTTYCDDNGLPKLSTFTLDYVKQNLKREIYIQVEQNATDANKVDITVTYQYKWRTTSIPPVYPAGIDGSTVYSEDIQKVSVAKTGTHNIFVIYTPINFDDGSLTKVVSDEVYMKGDLTALGVTAGKADDELNFRVYLIADSTVDRSNCIDGSYKLTLFNDPSSSHVISYVSDVFTNLLSAEFLTNGFAINGTTFPTASGHGLHYDTLMNETTVNRVAEIEVSVYRGDSLSDSNCYTTVNGTKVQSQ